MIEMEYLSFFQDRFHTKSLDNSFLKTKSFYQTAMVGEFDFFGHKVYKTYTLYKEYFFSFFLNMLSCVCDFLIVLLAGVLVVLDAHPGGIIYRDIIPEYVNYARTIYEGFKFTLSMIDFYYPLCQSLVHI